MSTQKVRHTLCIRWPETDRMRLHGVFSGEEQANATALAWRRVFAKRNLAVTVEVMPVFPATASWRDHGRAEV